MCNLYRMTKATAEIAHLFGARAGQGANFAAEVYPGYPGLVIAEGQARAMTWGFPLVLKGRQGQPLKPKPVTNAREELRAPALPDPGHRLGRGRRRERRDDPHVVFACRRRDIRCRRSLASDRGMGPGLFDGDGRWLRADGRCP